MARINEYDEDYSSSFTKIHSSHKPRAKGHQSKRGTSESERWANILSTDDELTGDDTPAFTPSPRPTPTYRPQQSQAPISAGSPTTSQPQPTATPIHEFGPNTHEIKGVKIDFDGVASIEKITSEHNGMTTYGIKFLFKGKKGLFRIIWFNTNLRLRDTTFDSEYAFWTSLLS